MVDVDFNTLTLREIANAFNARRKALKHKTQGYSVSRQMDGSLSESDDEVLLIEMTAIDLKRKLATLQVKVWPDRWVSGVAYLRGHSRENWTSEFEGRISATLNSVAFQKEIEGFLDGICIGMYRSTNNADTYWRNKLLRGPKGIVE